MKINNHWPLVIVIIILFLIYHQIFFPVISGGDYNNIAYLLPYWQNSFFIWDSTVGLGRNVLPLIHYAPYASLIIFAGHIFSTNMLEKLFFWLAFILLGSISSYALTYKFLHNRLIACFSAFIYMVNTYSLLMIGGGQIAGIGLAYALVPLAFLTFFVGMRKPAAFQKIVSYSIVMTMLMIFDIRIAYITIAAMFLYVLFSLFLNKFEKNKTKKTVIFLVSAAVLALLLQMYWILPAFFFHKSALAALGSGFTSQNAVTYFSFAKFENTISLLHPNWPENIFGKVGFMKPEFLLTPIFAYASLLFLKYSKSEVRNPKQMQNSKSEIKNNVTIEQSNNKIILYFALLGLIGAFLAKGANDPFGFFYLWMFNHVPGFVMFRDPTKFYVLIALSYSILIPYSLWQILERVSSIKYKILREYGKFIVLFIFIFFWLFTIRQAVFDQLTGTFNSVTIPQEYVQFEQFLLNNQQFSRTFWVPITQRFGFSSANHPAVSAEDFFNVYDEKSIIKKLKSPETEELLQAMGVKYIIVPTDSQKEIFLVNRNYSEKLYKQTVMDVSKLSWLKPLDTFNNLAVFQVPDPKDHFWSSDSHVKISYSFVNPTQYDVSLSNVKKGDRLIFSDSFDSHWVLIRSKYTVVSIKYDNLFNSFVLPQNGNYNVEIYYAPQKWVDVGVWISLVTLVGIIGWLIVLKQKND